MRRAIFLSALVGAVIVSVTAVAVANPFVDTGQSLVGGSTSGVAIADFDGDGNLDVFAGIYNSPDRLHRNDGTGTFVTGGNINPSRRTQGIATADLNGDTFLDIYGVANAGHMDYILFNDGAGNFTDSGQTLGTLNRNSIALGDVDGDLDIDAIIGTNTATANELWLNDGAGNFTLSGQVFPANETAWVLLADLDGDLDLDAYFATTGADELWLNDGNGNFTQSGQTLDNSFANEAAAVDVDGDLDLDLVIGNQSGGGNSRVWLNNGSGVFTNAGSSMPGGAFGMAIDDFDGDGDADVYFIFNNAVGQLWLNDGLGVFSNSGLSFPNVPGRDTKAGDFDGDGDADIYLAIGNGINDQILRNDQAPVVKSIVRAGANPANFGTSLVFTVTFSHKVSGVDAADFALAVTGTISGASILAVEGSDFTRTVTVSGGEGDGTIGLNLVDDDSILVVDAGAVPLGDSGAGNGDFTGEAYTFNGQRPHVTVEQAAGQADPANTGVAVRFTVTFSEPVTGFDAADVGFNLANFTGTIGDISNLQVSGGPSAYSVSFMAAAQGIIVVGVAANAVLDADMNANYASTSIDGQVTIGTWGLEVRREGTAIAAADTLPGVVGKGMVTEVSYTIHNTGTADLVLAAAPALTAIDGANIVLDYAGDFTIAAGDSETFKLMIDPTVAGAISATISVAAAADPANPTVFTISGTATGGSNACGMTGSHSPADLSLVWLLLALGLALGLARRLRG